MPRRGRLRLVANWIVDVPFAWGAQFSGVLTLGTGSRYDGVIARLSRDAASIDEEAREDEDRRREAHDLVVWGIAQVGNDGYREVLELTHLEQLSGEEIARRLQISDDNVYQRRRRGLKQLEMILRDS